MKVFRIHMIAILFTACLLPCIHAQVTPGDTTDPTGRAACFVIAASDTPSDQAAQADVICMGENDQETINEVLNGPIELGKTPNRRVLLLEGHYNCSNAIKVADRNVTIEGQGMGVTILRFTGASDGISVTLKNDFFNANIMNLTIWTQKTESAEAAAIRLSGPHQLPGYFNDPMFTVKNVEITPDDNSRGRAFWDYGIKIWCAQTCCFENVAIWGKNASTDMRYGIHSDGPNMSLFFKEICITHAECGAYICDTTEHISEQDSGPEGIMFSNPHIVNVVKGIEWESPLAEGVFQVIGGHIAAKSVGISLTNCNNSTISGVNFHEREDSVYSTWTGISISSNSSRVALQGNTFVGHETEGTQISLGIQVNGDFCSVTGNVFQTIDYGVLVSEDSSFSTVTGNSCQGCNTQMSQNGLIVMGDFCSITGNNFYRFVTPILLYDDCVYCTVTGNNGFGFSGNPISVTGVNNHKIANNFPTYNP